MRNVEASEAPRLSAIAPSALMPRLLALEASKVAAVRAFELVAPSGLVNVFLAVYVWAPDRSFIAVYSASQPDVLDASILLLIKVCL